MKHNPDGSISELPKVKLHSKQLSTLLDTTELNKGEVETLIKVLDNHLE